MLKNRLITLSFISVLALAALIALQAFWILLSIKNNRQHTREHLIYTVSQNSEMICKSLKDSGVVSARLMLTKLIIDDLKESASPLKFDLKIVGADISPRPENAEGVLFMPLSCEGGRTDYFVYIRCDTSSWLAFGKIFWWASTSILILVLLTGAVLVSLLNQYKIKKLEKVKSDFISNMTHELKTPISTISVASEMLLKTGNPFMNKEKAAKYAEIIYEENNRLKSLVDKVLRISIFEKGQAVYKFAEAEIHEILNAAVKKTEMLIKEKSIALNMELLASHTLLRVDKSHILNVFINIIENAVKYSGSHTSLSIETKDAGGGIEILFKDNGPGIPDKMKSLVFQRFSRVSQPDIHNVKGFGLGLYYVKTVLEAHGGTVAVRDNKPSGAVFVIFLPLDNLK